jgi:hypothetical protein
VRGEEDGREICENPLVFRVFPEIFKRGRVWRFLGYLDPYFEGLFASNFK